jgi:FkbM family methyltransferase
MPEEYKQILVQNVESVIPNAAPIILNNVSREHAGWFTFAEIETKYFLTRVLQNDSVCFDVGANIGLYSILFLQQSPESQVFAFEPSSNFKFLEQNIPQRLKERFHAFQLGLGDKNGVFENEIWESFGHKKVKDNFSFATLDRFVENHLVNKIDVLKIDTDGFETQILDGSLETLRKFHPLIVIETDESLGSGQSSLRIKLALDELGYLNLGTLDGNNEIYAHRSDSRLSVYQGFIQRHFRVNKTFLGALTSTIAKTSTGNPVKKLKFTSNANSRFFFQKIFFTNGVPWNYAATSSVVDGGTRFLKISGLILGTDANLICISDNVPTLFSLPLPSGLYTNILIPLKNFEDASNIRVVVRGSGRNGRALILGLRIDAVA